MAKKVVAGLTAIALIALFGVWGALRTTAGVRDQLRRLVAVDQLRTEAVHEIEVNSSELGFAVFRYAELGDAGSQRVADEETREIEENYLQYVDVATPSEMQGAGELHDDLIDYGRLGLQMRELSDRERKEFASLEIATSVLLDRLQQPALIRAERERAGGNSIFARLGARLTRLASDAAYAMGPAGERSPGRSVEILREMDGLVRRAKNIADRTIWADLDRAWADVHQAASELNSLQTRTSRVQARFLKLGLAIDRVLDEQIQVVAMQQLRATQQDAADRAEDLVRLAFFGLPAFLLLVLAIGFVLITSLRRPLVRLIAGTRAIGEGDFSHRVSTGKDELGELGSHFNEMAELLESSVRQMQVGEEELQKANEQLGVGLAELKDRNETTVLTSEMVELIQASTTDGDTYDVIKMSIQQLFPGFDGRLYMLDSSQARLATVVTWGDVAGDEHMPPEECWGYRRGHLHLKFADKDGLRCGHIGDVEASLYTCVPLMAQGEKIGLLSLWQPPGAGETRVHLKATMEGVGESIALALMNFRLREELRYQSIRDPLTGLFNRRYLEETLDREIHRAGREGVPLSVAMLDVDHFKEFNDRAGHRAGDEVLQRLGAHLRKEIRTEDISCRYGGEEFLLVLPGASSEDAHARLEGILASFRGQVPNAEPPGFVTFSVGHATMPKDGITAESLILEADRALYAAKRGGRNRVVKATEPSPADAFSGAES